MIAVIQRAKEASVAINGTSIASIKLGLLVLLGIEDADNEEDVIWLSNKILNLRIFDDTTGSMNVNCKDVAGEIIVVSQFTLHANVNKGNRPSYIRAAKPEIAIPLYKSFLETIEEAYPGKIKSGEFGANMQIGLINDGPVTIIINTKNKT